VGNIERTRVTLTVDDGQAYYLQKVKENCKEHFKAKREL
jgi:hypothetical protein